MAFKSCKSVSPTFHFIYDTLIHHRINHHTPTIIRFFETQSIANNSNFTENQALTISYLTKSCGLSFKSALSASMKLKIESTEKSNSVLELLRSHGFTKNHISFLISRRPQLILADPENVRPKFEYIESLGYVGTELPKIICSCNRLHSSLDNRIKPTFDFLKPYLRTDKNLIYPFKQSANFVLGSVEKVMVPNIHTLRAHGVPKSHIEKLIMRQPRALILSVDVFKEVTNAVKEMGFDPKSQSFLWAILPISRNTKSDWEKKKRAYMRFGWSESTFNSAFKLRPTCMLCSKTKIRKVMDFFVNKWGLRASEIAKYPNCVQLSLETRIIPRCAVLQVLMSKGLIGKDVNVLRVLDYSVKRFETRFLTKYKEVAPQVLKAYAWVR